MSTIEILIRYHSAFIGGLIVSLKLFGLVSVLGLCIGTALGGLAARYPASLGVVHHGAAFLLSGIPILVFLFWAHYPLQVLFDVVVDPFVTAAVVLTIVNVFAVSDTVRSVISDLPRQYVMAARACGLSPGAAWIHIELPLTLRQLVPALLPIQITVLHSTLFASLISVEEIFRVSQRINAQVYRPVEIYTALGVFFLAVSLPVNAIALWLRARLAGVFSER